MPTCSRNRSRGMRCLACSLGYRRRRRGNEQRSAVAAFACASKMACTAGWRRFVAGWCCFLERLRSDEPVMSRVAIIDYQMGNLRSVQKGFERVGVQADIVSDPRQIGPTDKVVLPGVGAFGDA